ncbi:transmembrane protein 238-like [Tiliqua scincoides]|uniref:transmembrane protein 238-like n=1 Tax=Tiliqua scincoides TaxID=71010 RepID=UPI0034618D99
MGRAGCGRCAVFLAAALVLDAVGLALVLAGTAGRPTLDGRPYEDFLALSGGLLLFLSLLCWLFWYSGNLRGVADEELPLGARPAAASAPRSHASLLRLAAKLSERLSQRRRRRSRSAPAPSLPPPATVLVRPPDPLELGSLRPAAHPEPGAAGERLV